MKELIQEIQKFKDKIRQVWKILNLDAKKTELKTLEIQMSQSDFWNNPQKAKNINQKAENIRQELATWEQIISEVKDLFDLAIESFDQQDNSLKKDLENKLKQLQKRFENLEFLVLFSKKYDRNNAIISIHAGTGGVDAQDWAQILTRMLLRFCEKRKFKTKILHESQGNETGIKSITFEVIGNYAYGWLRSEHGVHRLVRISPFDAEALRQTSFALVEVLPEVDQLQEIKIKDEDLKIDTFRSSGHGGQSVNTTDSAVRITHLPTGITASCQNERSQYANKRSAMKILQSKLILIHEENLKKQKEKLKGKYSQAQWGNQIRSYVLHPYKMIKDLRTHYEETDPEKVLDGNLENFIESYLRWDRKQNNN